MASRNTGVITPSYLTKDFLKKTIENGFNTTDVGIQEFSISEASAIGENFTSELLRVSIKYKLRSSSESQQISLIIKKLELEGECRQILRESECFKVEATIYTEILPKMESILGNSILGPKCFAVDEDNLILVLADLKALGYELEDRIKGLDQAHCEIIMKKMAQFHAASMHIAKKNPELLEVFNKPIFKDFSQSEYFVKYFTKNFQNTINLVKTWPTYEEIANKLERVIVNLLPKCCEITMLKEDDLRALVHTDLWVNNFMFKYSDSSRKPTDAVLFDFQMVKYGCLGVDLQYFLNTSPQLEVLKSKRYELLRVYYHTFKSTLEQLKYSPIPSWEDIRKEIRAREFCGLFFMACEFPLVCMDKSESSNLSIETFNDNSKEVYDAMFSSKRVQETFQYSLNRYDELGVLDE